jgi:hypothetical protein
LALLNDEVPVQVKERLDDIAVDESFRRFFFFVVGKAEEEKCQNYFSQNYRID